ncbi:hypothetical protein DOK78_000957 [Enterococcus sp. DIV2402]|uniref:Bcr/CflA family efflux transporter n=1 Tax=Candidatus Enterococcus lowellii TaxID=2230877 RepID=A0ABZ2SMG4_9ENTE|nr:multidrug effflux MFS transporter [Enterococcus sp. DIV2402]MBO0465710.1 multidrug effflux MFS transporter [Enterococcus sp. DIV2402]
MEKNIESNKISLALLVCLVGFPQISETIFTPSLTEIAKGYQVSINVSQMTLSIYFLAFAFGVFFWGITSDYFGRRVAMNGGLFIYTIGCLLCYWSTDIILLFVGRVIQAFGASTGSVTTQTILRDNYQGKQRHTLFAQISAALAFTPAIGPLIGGFLGQYFGYKMVFLALVGLGTFLLIWSLKKLPETSSSKKNHLNYQKICQIGQRMIVDKYTWTFCVLIGVLNGVLFGYHSEAPSIFIEKFGFTQAQYGFIGIVVALATVLGSFISKQTLERLLPETIILLGTKIALIGSLGLLVVSLLPVSFNLLLLLYLVGIFSVLTGVGIALPNCLSLALVNFTDVAGTAGAFLSLGYYVIVSILTFCISTIHTGSISILPVFFLGSFLLIYWMQKR